MLKGKNIILTGCNRGIGRAILYLLAKNGGNVWACCRTINQEFIAYTEELSSEFGVWIEPVVIDLTDEDLIEAAMQTVIGQKKAIDVLINNAGVTATSLLQQTTITEVKNVFQINYFANLYIVKKISKVMIRQKYGSIVNMASVAGIEHQPGRIAYGSSKASLIWMTQALAKELGPFNIRVNAVAPGAVYTQMIEEYSEDKIKKIRAETSLRRLGNVEEVAEVVVFLCSKNSSFITGQVIKVDGGR